MSANSTAGTVALAARHDAIAPRENLFTGKPYHWDAASNAVTSEVAADRDRSLVPWPL